MQLSTHRFVPAAALAAVVLLAGALAHAGVSKKVQAKFRGQILVTTEELPDTEGMSDVEAAQVLKKLDQSKIVGSDGGEVKSWTFYYTAFLKQPAGTKDLSLDFHKTDKDKTYAANSRLTVDPGLTIIMGRLTIDENEGPNPGTTYDLFLRGKLKGKEVVLAKTRITLE
jgi:hypothetical protein